MINIENEQDKVKLGENDFVLIKNAVNQTLINEGVDYSVEVSVMIVDNKSIREINKETRGIDKETDVLSFPMIEYKAHKTYKDLYKDYDFPVYYFNEEDLVLGDIVISAEQCKNQAEEYNHSFQRELRYLTVHSTLHLLGYDHIDLNQKKSMRLKEEEILKVLEMQRDN